MFGPLLYMLPLGEIIHINNVSFYSCPDDTEFYVTVTKQPWSLDPPLLLQISKTIQSWAIP